MSFFKKIFILSAIGMAILAPFSHASSIKMNFVNKNYKILHDSLNAISSDNLLLSQGCKTG